MKEYPADNIRNIALAGHGGSGKTSLAEAFLFVAGATKEKQIIAEVKLDGPIYSTPVAANGVLYIASQKNLYAFQLN